MLLPGFPGGEIGMLVVETVVRIRREHANGKAIRAIARDLRLSRKVVRKAIIAPEGAFGYRRSIQPQRRIGPFQERLDTLLTENEARHRRDRLISSMMNTYFRSRSVAARRQNSTNLPDRSSNPVSVGR